MPTSVKSGDRVLLPGWGGNAIKLGEEVRVFFFLSLGLSCWVGRLIGGFFCRSTSFSRIRRFWLRLRSRVSPARTGERVE